MLYPAMSELLKHVDSRYLLVNVVAHRARQLSIESEMTHEPLTDKPVTIFHGKMFSPKNLTPLKDLGGEGGKCMIWGDVFFTYF